MSIKKIKVFDFDSTLVNTPPKPQGFKGGWWGRDHSLLPPFVPHYSEIKEKGAHLLNSKVVEAYLESKACSETHTVMMTGRHWGIHRCVMNILHGFDLCSKEDCDSLVKESDHFVFISGGKTLEGKLTKLSDLFVKYEDVTHIEMWEDREEHIHHFREHIHTLRKCRPIESLIVHTPPDWG